MSIRTTTPIAQSNERRLQLANTLPADLPAVFDCHADAFAVNAPSRAIFSRHWTRCD
jgi:hypothetical protein